MDTGRDPGSLTGWTGIVAALYGRRAAAFAGPSAAGGGLDGVYVPGSRQLAADRTQLRALARAGEMLRGFAPTVEGVTHATTSGDRAELLLTDRWAPYDIVPARADSASTLRSGSGRPSTSVRLTLQRTAAGWRIADAERLS